MSFQKTWCLKSPNNFTSEEAIKLDDEQEKFICLLSEIYPRITTFLERVFTENLFLYSKQFNDSYQKLKKLYDLAFESGSLDFINEYHPSLPISLLDIEPQERLDWLDNYRYETNKFYEIIKAFDVSNEITLPVQVKVQIERCDELLSGHKTNNWDMFLNESDGGSEENQKHWLKGNTFYYRMANGKVISFMFDKSPNQQTSINYELFRTLYSQFLKNTSKTLTGDEITEQLDKTKVKHNSRINTMIANLRRKIKISEISIYTEILFADGGYKLTIK